MQLKNVKVDRTIFKNDGDKFAILACVHEGRPIRIKGKLADIAAGAVLTLDGDWESHPKYGDTFKVTGWEEAMPKDVQGVEKYLASGLIKGIGKKTAELIVKQFGEKALDILDREPEKLLKVKGISEKKLKRILDCWKTQREIRQVMVFLKSHEVSNAMAYRIYGEYGISCIDILSKNPYQLADDVRGIGFVSADKIAADFGVAKDSPQRILAGLNYVLSQKCEKDGCVFIERETLTAEAGRLLGVDAALVQAQADLLGQSDDVVVREGRFYPAMFFYAEKGVAHRLTALAGRTCHTDVDFTRIEALCGVSFADAQRDAITAAMDNMVCVMTGGPGTGKTTTTNGIIQALAAAGKEVLLAAPTGRAAKRMSEATGMEAKTIHRLLEFDFENGFKRDEDNLLEGDALIVDEASMIDVILMNSLLKAVPGNMQVVIVGDVDQLPSVGCGNCLHDVIASGHVEVIRLTKIFRQAEGSDIIKNAHRINAGELPVLSTGPGSDFHFERCDDGEQVRRLLVERCTAFVRGGGRICDIQVLTPMKPGLCGMERLNTDLQAAVNPPSKNKGELRFLSRTFRKGDKVMQMKNDYDKDVFNGDTGLVLTVDEEEGYLTVEFNGNVVEYKETELGSLELAYACTIHKSQGSEFAHVLIPMSTQHYVMHQRNLLYTAVTRAKKSCTLIGNPLCVRRCVENNVMKLRNSTLIEQMEDYDF